MADRILITGGAGFLGYHLAVKLLDDGFVVHLVDNFSRGVEDHDLEVLLSQPNCTFESIDCLDRESVLGLGTDFDYIFHLAAIIGVVHVNRRPYRVLMDNMLMLDNMLQLASNQIDFKRSMFPSTSEVYAGTLEHFDLEIPSPETTPLAITELSRPRTSYMLSKISGECLCHYSGVPFTIFRPHNIYGPRMGSIHVVPGQLKKAYDAKDGESVLVSSVNQTRSFCFVDDATIMLSKMMILEECLGKTLNLGAELPEITILDLSKICHEVVGREVKIQPEQAPPGSPSRRAPDMQSTNLLIQYEAETPLRVGIEKTYQWYLQNIFLCAGKTAD